MDVWALIKQKLAQKLSTDSYQNWFEKTYLRESQEPTIWVTVPNEVAKEYLEQEYTDLIAQTIRELNLPFEDVFFELPVNGNGNGHSRPLEPGVNFEKPATQLNTKFSFDSYVVGSCNQFAHAAARAVASKPSQSYNPLFIYGGVGMGKTHLMHAIGRSLLDNYGGMRIVYTSSERFMNEMISCIRLRRMPLFHEHYRSADVLLIDDIQILGRKEATQEEFFHTFNELYEHQKQIVISSDSPPKEIPGLVERLRSRFEWGLMVDIQPPDLETKMAILDKKAEQEGIRLPDDVRIFIATKTKSNVRELEGALVKLMAYSSVTGAPINLSMAQHVLKHMVINQREHKVTIDSIIRAVAARYNLQPAQLKLRSNAQKIAFPRQIAMHLAKEMTGSSLPEIGRAFGGKHHTTVLHSVAKIEQLRQKDSDLDRTIHTLMDSLG